MEWEDSYIYDLKEAGIDAIITNENSVEKALELYMKGMLADYPDKGCHHSEEKGCGQEQNCKED